MEKYKQRLRDLVSFSNFPKLRKDLHRAIEAGLETLLDYQRLSMLVAAVHCTSDIQGDVIEFGTFRGGSAGVILQNLKAEKIIHVCDSFEGMPDVSTEDNFHQKGDFAETGAEKVKLGLSKLGNNFRMHVGFFSDTIPVMEKDKSLKFSLVHIDADLYDSIIESLEFCYPRMSKGGLIIFDDYGAPSCLGAKKAVDEFFADKTEKIVQLSGDQYGCIVKGGNAFVELTSKFSLLGKISTLNRRVFNL